MVHLTVGEAAKEESTSYVARQNSFDSVVADGPPSSASEKSKAPGSKPSSKEDQPKVWRATWLHFGPLSGLVGMVLAALSLTASLGILVGSNGQSVNGWNAPPSTYIAIFTAIGNLSVRYAVTQGVIIAWWKRASRGSTLSSLQSDWQAGTMLRGAITAGRRMGLLGLACVFATIVVIDGPLLQRASTVVEISNPATVPLEFSMSPEIPHSFSGTWYTAEEAGVPGYRNSFGFNSTVPSPNGPVSNLILSNSNSNANSIIAPWYKTEPIKGVVRGCSGECKSVIRAPGLFPASCMTQTYPVDLPYKYNMTAVEDNIVGPPLETDVIVIVAALDVEYHEKIVIVTGFTTFHEGYKGDFRLQTCTLKSGIGEYEVSIQNDQIIMTSLGSPTLVALANNTAVNRTWKNDFYGIYGHPSTLGGVVNTMEAAWQTYVSCFLDESQGGAGLSALGIGQEGIYQFQTKDLPGLCQSYSDPHDVIVDQLNKMMFYLGAVAAKMDPGYLATNLDAGLLTNTTGVGSVQGNIDVYHTDYWFFLGAAVLEVVCLALISPTYWGWWRLGRPVSFSPLEMARAFRSPLLAEYNSNSTGRDLAVAATDIPIKYGVLTSEDGGKSELAFADPTLVSRPSQGARFDI